MISTLTRLLTQLVITLEDLDLNVDSDLIDIYTTVSGSAITALNDVVGSDANPFEFSDGDRLGRVLDVTFDDQLWTDPWKRLYCLTWW